MSDNLYLYKKNKIMSKYCLECGEEIVGRIDKKFCSDQCRNTYNNKLNRDEINLARRINRILRKNRKILADINTKGKAKVSKRKLLDLGFHFDYHTNIYETQNGKVYYFCYDQGIIANDDGSYTIVTRKEYVN
jgi:predicted nucleic acid-binding Zn ribbon protein